MSNLNQNKLPLLDKIKEYIDENNIRLHMPGHKGTAPHPNSILQDLWSCDLTEVAGLDDYHQPREAIKEAQQLLSSLYNTEKSYFLINGASSGIHAAFMALSRPGDRVLLPRHSHKSVVGAMIFSGVTPVYIPSTLGNYGMPLGADWEYINQKKLNSSNIKILFLQNPTYEGIAENINIKNKFNSNTAVVVDEAHGGHFGFHHLLPESALDYNCDAVIHGAHKTLGSLTQTGFLHLKSRNNIKNIEEALSLLQSTSPSYPLLASLDLARYKMAVEGYKDLSIILQKASMLRNEINKIPGLYCLRDEDIPDRKLDATKITVITRNLYFTGFEIDKYLRKKYNIQVEMARKDYIVLMLTMGDINLDITKILKALQELVENQDHYAAESTMSLPQIPELVIPPRDAFFADKVTEKLENSVGEISGETISPYPPGIPVICAGEKITYEVVKYLKELKESGGFWQGSSDLNLKTITIIK